MNRTSRNRFVAWLGIAAMWLAIVAPVISQTLASRDARYDLIATLCSVDAPHHAQSASSVPNALQANEHGGHHAAGGAFDACSYCGLLAHNVPLASVPAAALVRMERVTRLRAGRVAHAVYIKSFNAASPRAPPVVS